MLNTACHVKQSIIACRSSRKGEQVSKKNIESAGSVLRGSDSNHKNFTPQVFMDLWNGGTSV